MHQLIRYGVVGVASNAAMYFVYLVFTYFGIEPKTAMTLVYLIGASLGFFANRKWTFSHRGGGTSAALRYIQAHLLGYVLNFMILYAFVDRLGYAHQWVQAAAIIIVACILFVVFKFYVFREKLLRS